jgi:hypothetical protein
MTKLYRLLSRAQLDGEVRQPGYVFTLAEGERGPHRTVVWSMPDRCTPRTHDEPLYEEIKAD